MALDSITRQLDGPGNREAARLIARIGGRDVGDSVSGQIVVIERGTELLRRKKSQFSVRRQTLRLLTTPKPRPRCVPGCCGGKKCANRSTCSAEAAPVNAPTSTRADARPASPFAVFFPMIFPPS